MSADLVSRYVWRGLDYTNAPCFQPSLTYTNGGLEIGAWAATTLANNAQMTDEINLFAGYSAALGDAGSLGIVVTDYYFPNLGVGRGLGDCSDGNGAHVLEVGAQFNGEEIPFWVHVFINVWNDADNSVYAELGYTTAVGNTDLSLHVGGTTGGDLGFYGTVDASLINVGITAERSIEVTDSFSVPVFCSLIANPSEDILRVVFGMTLE